MTVKELEEMAEDYVRHTRIKDKNTYPSFPDESISEVSDFEGNRIDITERIIKAYKDGCEAGQKDCEQCLASFCKTEKELKAKYEELKNKYEVLSIIDAYSCDEFTKLEQKNAELKAYIEKLKCCGNCKHFNIDEIFDYSFCDECKRVAPKGTKDNWELAE